VRAAGTDRCPIMSAHGFASTFARELDEYLAFKANMGCYGSSRIWYLKKFDTYCVEHDRADFDRGTVEGWVTERLERSGRYRSWMSYIRDFGRWLQAQGNGSAYVLSDQWKAPFVPAHPYLMASHEIESFFTAASTFTAQSPWQWQAVAFFTLMNRRSPRPVERACRPGRRAPRHLVVQRQPQPQAAFDRRDRRDPHRLRAHRDNTSARPARRSLSRPPPTRSQLQRSE
jgi:hypothetical protein